VVTAPHPDSARLLAENRRHYELLVEVTAHHAARGDVERVLRASMVAANYGWLAHTGLLGDLRLERSVVHAVRGSGTVTVDGGRRTGRVLHVLSEAYGIGGHTRQAAQWMQQDPRDSDVVLTNQLGPVPEGLLAAARAAGGTLHDLRSTTPGLLDRARELRRHMDRADLVVLTVHPYDSIVLAAANLPGVRPPVVYANHADLGYWLGVGATDLLCDLRPEVRSLSEELRRVPGGRIGVLPLPVSETTSSEGGRLRRELGLRPDAVVAVTVADDWKVAPSWGRGMHQVVDNLLHWSPRLAFVLVGVTPNAHWERLAKRYPGRVACVGKVPQAGPYLDLGEIFLESYPTRAGTTPLEAAMVGLPVVALADLPADDPARVFQTGSPGLAGHSATSTAEELNRTVRRLVADPELRRSAGAGVRAAVLDRHSGPGWRAQLETLYEQARALTAADVDTDELPESPSEDRYGAMLLSALGTVSGSPDPRLLTGCLGEQFDSVLQADLFAAVGRTVDSPFRVRVASGWEQHLTWTARLLELSSAFPRLAVSLPFLPGDGRRGEQTEALVLDLLARAGRTPEDCGDISVDSRRPPSTGLELTGEPEFTDEALDHLEQLVGSPLWSPGGARVPDPAPVG
jgi:glycosyltransferase involved in cell wall biosynthesis